MEKKCTKKLCFDEKTFHFAFKGFQKLLSIDDFPWNYWSFNTLHFFLYLWTIFRESASFMKQLNPQENYSNIDFTKKWKKIIWLHVIVFTEKLQLQFFYSINMFNQRFHEKLQNWSQKCFHFPKIDFTEKLQYFCFCTYSRWRKSFDKCLKQLKTPLFLFFAESHWVDSVMSALAKILLRSSFTTFINIVVKKYFWFWFCEPL